MSSEHDSPAAAYQHRPLLVTDKFATCVASVGSAFTCSALFSNAEDYKALLHLGFMSHVTEHVTSLMTRIQSDPTVVLPENLRGTYASLRKKISTFFNTSPVKTLGITWKLLIRAVDTRLKQFAKLFPCITSLWEMVTNESSRHMLVVNGVDYADPILDIMTLSNLLRELCANCLEDCIKICVGVNSVADNNASYKSQVTIQSAFYSTPQIRPILQQFQKEVNTTDSAYLRSRSSLAPMPLILALPLFEEGVRRGIDRTLAVDPTSSIPTATLTNLLRNITFAMSDILVKGEHVQLLQYVWPPEHLLLNTPKTYPLHTAASETVLQYYTLGPQLSRAYLDFIGAVDATNPNAPTSTQHGLLYCFDLLIACIRDLHYIYYAETVPDSTVRRPSGTILATLLLESRRSVIETMLQDPDLAIRNDPNTLATLAATEKYIALHNTYPKVAEPSIIPTATATTTLKTNGAASPNGQTASVTSAELDSLSATLSAMMPSIDIAMANASATAGMFMEVMEGATAKKSKSKKFKTAKPVSRKRKADAITASDPPPLSLPTPGVVASPVSTDPEGLVKKYFTARRFMVASIKVLNTMALHHKKQGIAVLNSDGTPFSSVMPEHPKECTREQYTKQKTCAGDYYNEFKALEEQMSPETARLTVQGIDLPDRGAKRAKTGEDAVT